MTVSLYAFSCGMFQAATGFFLSGADDEPVLRLPIPAYLIRHPDGLAVFDTGLGYRFRREIDAKLKPDELGFEFHESVDIASQLRAIDVDPAAVRWVINSHLHADHCGGNALIPNATVVIQSRELAFAREHDDGMLYAKVDYDLGHEILAVDGEHDLYGDGSVVLFPTYGHTAGHQSARVRLPKGDVVLAADCCYLKRSLTEMRLPKQVQDVEESLRTLRRLGGMQAKGARIFYGHDGEFWKEIPQSTALE